MNIIVSKARQELDFHITTIPIQLDPCTPSPIVPEEITKQLNDIGLYCDQTYGENLKKNIDDVTKKITSGPLQAYGIYKDNGPLNAEQLANLNISLTDAPDEEILGKVMAERFTKKAEGEWTTGSTGGYQGQLTSIQHETNFEYLKKNCTDFPYAECPSKTTTSNCGTVEAIKRVFVEALTSCTAATVQGVTLESLKAVFSNALNTLNSSVLENNYSTSENRVICLVHNYNAKTGDADGVGVVTCKWSIQIENYKEKKSDRHESAITVSARSVLYTDDELLEKHYNMIKDKKNLLDIMINT